MKIWDCFMFRDELDVLEMRLTALEDDPRVEHVMVEATTTHRGVPKPLLWEQYHDEFAKWAHRVHYVGYHPTVSDAPWTIEHKQRNAAWAYIDRLADDNDVVFICDVDEIPGEAMLKAAERMQLANALPVAAVWMRTCIFAVDWEVDSPLPPTCVMARVGWLREQRSYGAGLAEVRDDRSSFPVRDENGGWHLSWLGGPERQREKLHTATCHVEMLGTPEAALIESGARWATDENGGGLPVRPVDVDSSWPLYVYDRRCPPSWFRPRER